MTVNGPWTPRAHRNGLTLAHSMVVSGKHKTREAYAIRGAHLVAFVDLLQSGQAAHKGVGVLQVAGRAFFNMHVCVCDAIDVHDVFVSGHNDVGGSGVAESNVLVLDHLRCLVSFVFRNQVEGAASEEGFWAVAAVGPLAVGHVERF